MKVDLSYLREMAGNNKELILEMISIFKSQVIEFGEGMEQLLSNNEFELLGKLAHKAKSSVSIMGLDDLAKKLSDLENSAKEGKHIDGYKKTIAAFKTETAEAIEELNLVVDNLDLYF
jgi:HPt (histidine-containing phosphotransfer) domain-containing protein